MCNIYTFCIIIARTTTTTTLITTSTAVTTINKMIIYMYIRLYFKRQNIYLFDEQWLKMKWIFPSSTNNKEKNIFHVIHLDMCSSETSLLLTIISHVFDSITCCAGKKIFRYMALIYLHRRNTLTCRYLELPSVL